MGICAAIPDNFATKQAIYLGDVIAGTKVWRTLHNARIVDLGPDEGVKCELRNLETENSSERVRQIGKLLATRAFRDEISNIARTKCAVSSAY